MGWRLSLWRDARGAVRDGWVVVTFAAIAVAVIAGLNLTLAVLGLGDLVPLGEPALLFLTLPTLLGGVAATWACARLFRVPANLLEAHRVRRFAEGFGLGALALSVACLVPVLLGVTQVARGQATALQLGLHLLTLAPAGIGEELLLRGLAFRALARAWGPAPAVLFTGGLFGVLHLMNPQSTWLAALVIGLVGAWFGTLAWRSGSLWLPMGLHVAWNFFEGAVFGLPVSGLESGSSLLVTVGPSAPGFWSGGAFGPEAAGWTAVVLALATAASLRYPARAP